ncbi:MAG: hypothetical protein HOV78_11435 [Hamadaea sp.]|nr:hypothetical protein [Hamadaea sp.]
MRAITVQQPWAWAILRGGKNVENRANRRGAAAAKKQFNHQGTVLIHAGQRYAGAEAHSRVQHLSAVDPGMPGAPQSDTAWAFGAFLGTAILVSVHTSEECYDPATGRLCSPWADDHAAHLVLAAPKVLRRPVPHQGQLGLWHVTDSTVLSQIRRQSL